MMLVIFVVIVSTVYAIFSPKNEYNIIWCNIIYNIKLNIHINISCHEEIAYCRNTSCLYNTDNIRHVM